MGGVFGLKFASGINSLRCAGCLKVQYCLRAAIANEFAPTEITCAGVSGINSLRCAGRLKVQYCLRATIANEFAPTEITCSGVSGINSLLQSGFGDDSPVGADGAEICDLQVDGIGHRINRQLQQRFGAGAEQFGSHVDIELIN